LTHGRFKADEYVLGAYYNQDIRARRFVPDLTQQATSLQGPDFTSTGRLTWQATPRNKFTGYMTNGNQHYPIWLTGLLGTVTRAPEATLYTKSGNNIYQATWTSPVTSRLLFEAGASHNPTQVWWHGQEWAANDIPGILDLATNTYSRNTGAAWTATERESPYRTYSFRGAMSYVTGSHTFRTGFSYMDSQHYDTQYWRPGALPLTYLTFNGAAVQATYYDQPAYRHYTMHNLGFHGEDQWRVKRLTVNAGVRFDHMLNRNPAISANPSIFVPVARFYPAADAVRWSDLSPRLGVAYDPFGDGKTAIKASANRYVLRNGNSYAVNINPLNTNRINNRSWVDRNDNFFPDGDPLNPDANGELGPSSNRDFTNPHINAFYDPDFAFGFGRRPSDWEFSAGFQRELTTGLSANVSYFRRVYTNFEVTDNLAFGPSDVDYFCVTAPVSAALPGGGGNQVCGIPDLKPNKVGLLNNLLTRADNIGTRLQHWNGVDATVNARLRGILLQGGLNVGKTSVNECNLASSVPEILFPNGTGTRTPLDQCDNTSVGSLTSASFLGGSTTPWLMQVKLLGSYMLPYEIQVAATYQTVPGPERRATVTYSNAVVQPALGRPLSQTTSVTINVIDPGTVYAERLHQLDLRVTKLLKLGRGRLRANLDVYNALNNNAPLNFPTAFNAANPILWQRPGVIMPARLAKVSFQVDF
jgi:hypothetical protein